MKHSATFRRSDPAQQGYAFMVILLMLALLMIALVAVAPKVATEIRREREKETIHRATQYVRAIRLFYRKFGRYPNSIKELENTNNLRFLRQEYKDPLAPDGSWRIIHYGQAKYLPKQLQMMAGATTAAGAGMTGGFGTPSGSMFGGSSQGGSTFGGSTFGGVASGPTNAPPGTVIAGQAPTNQNAQEQPGQPGQPAQGTGDQGQQPGTPVSSMGTLSGQTFGGGAIIGVAPNSKERSIMVINERERYNEWEFVYDPRLDIAQQAGAAGITGRPNQVGQPAGQQKTGGFSLGPGPSFGGGMGQQPQTPQQPPQQPQQPQQPQ